MQKHKAARMDEWSQLPLRGWSDMERWMTAMSNQFAIEQPGDGSVPEPFLGGYTVPVAPAQDDIRAGIEAQTQSGIHAWQPRDETHGSQESRRQPPEMLPYSGSHASAGSEAIASPARGAPGCSNASVLGEDSVRVAERGQSNRAEELSTSEPSIYF